LAAVPDPPADLTTLSPLTEVWERGRPIVRCHNVRFGATEFNPGVGRGRFHPFLSRGWRPVPTLYGADCVEGALSETVFHNVPMRGPGKVVLRTSLRPLVLSTLTAARDLNLAQLHGYGLPRLGITRGELIEAEADQYERTADWARAIHDAHRGLDGLAWISRQHDDASALVLFGDRVARGDLKVEEPPLVLFAGRGFDRVRDAAEKAAITIVM
jgi:hypothetical protein